MKTCKMLHRLESRIDNKVYRISYEAKSGEVKMISVLERSAVRAKAAVRGMKDFARMSGKTRRA
jgi:hypothetical protein